MIQEPIPLDRRVWRSVLQNRGLLLQSHQKFQDVNWLPIEARSIDRLTGLPVLNDEVRNILIGELSQCVRNNGKWACINVDADLLKTANDKPELGRSFGDEYIRWETATVTDALIKIPFSDETTIRVIRPTRAADEIIVWFFNLSDEDMKKIPQVQKLIGISIPIPELSFNFSLSTGLLTSDDPTIKDSLVDSQQWLLSRPEAQAFKLFQRIEDKTGELAKIEKIAKDLYRLPLEELIKQENISSLITIMKNNLGGSRISGHLLELILKLQSVQTIRLLNGHLDKETYRKMLIDLGVDVNLLNNIKSPEQLVNIFRDLFGEE